MSYMDNLSINVNKSNFFLVICLSSVDRHNIFANELPFVNDVISLVCGLADWVTNCVVFAIDFNGLAGSK